MPLLSSRRVEISENGRSGSITYRESSNRLDFYWEFGGGDVVAIIQVNDTAAWNAPPAWLANRRGEVLRFVAEEVRKQKTPSSRIEINEQAGEILLRQGGAGAVASSASSAVSVPESPNAAFLRRYSAIKAKFAVIVLILGLIFGGVVWLRNKLFMIDPGKGTPVGFSLRTDKHIATLIQTLEPYIPSLNRDHSKDTYRLSLFLVPLDGSETRLINIQGGLSPSSYSLARVLGSDGKAIWFDAPEIGAVDLQTFKLLEKSELRGQPPRPRETGSMGMGPKVEHHLSAGIFLNATDWLGLHSKSEAERDFHVRSGVRRVVHAEDARQSRQFYRGVVDQADPISKFHHFISIAPAGTEEYLNAAFLRMDYFSEPIRLSNPDGALMIHTSAPGSTGTLVVARVDVNGKIIWKTDTGIDRFNLKQILPAESSIAFVGPRPPVPNKVSEPLLVIVDTTSGKVITHTLWR